MARLTLIVDLETTEEYDGEASEYARRREGPTPADNLGREITIILNGHRLVKRVDTVKVTTVVSGSRVDQTPLPAYQQPKKAAG